MSRLLTMSVAVVLMTLAGTAAADTILSAVLTNAAEGPNVVPKLQDGVTSRLASFGTATFVLNTAQTSMTMNAQVFNIDFTGNQTADTNDNLTNAHIHASDNVTGTNTAGVVWGFIGSPQNTPNDVVVTPFANGVGGTVTATWDQNEGNNGTTLTAQLSRILNNEFAGDLPHAYVNFHTNQFSSGEVRGYLTVVVPEPSTVAIFACGLVGLVAIGRRRFRSR